jgi:hypothetical protein
MTRSIAAALLVLAPLACCTEPHPFVRAGNANSVEVVYSGDPASALPAARQHCARYERVPRLVNAGDNIALFDCVGR